MLNFEEKIKKLLALADNPGASENEAEVALAMAQKLAAKHAVDITKLQTGEIEEGFVIFTLRQGKRINPVEKRLSSALQALYACKPFISGKTEIKVACPKSMELAIKNTFEWLIRQIEKECQKDLPDEYFGRERSEFERTFKWACAVKIVDRAQDLTKKLTTDNGFAQAEAGTTSLAIRESRKDLMSKAYDELAANGIHLVRSAGSKIKAGSGTVAGSLAGNRVQLRQGLV